MAYFSVKSGSLFTLFHSERKKNIGGGRRALKMASVAEVDTRLGSCVSFNLISPRHNTWHTADARGEELGGGLSTFTALVAEALKRHFTLHPVPTVESALRGRCLDMRVL